MVEAFVHVEEDEQQVHFFKILKKKTPQKSSSCCWFGLVAGILLYIQNLQEWDALFHKLNDEPNEL